MTPEEQIKDLLERVSTLEASVGYIPMGANFNLISPRSIDPGHLHTVSSITDLAISTIADSFEAGEAIVAGDSISLMAKPTSDVLYQPTSDANYNFGDTGGNEFLGQGFIPSATGYICKVGVYLKKVGSPSDNITIAIYSGTTAPTTLVDSVTLAGSSLTTSLAWYYPLFYYKQQMTASSQYFLVLSRSGANNGSNYYQWGGKGTGTYSGTYNTAWRGTTAITMSQIGSAPDYNDLIFEVYKESTSAVVIRKSIASSQLMVNNWIGFAPSAIVLAATGSVTRYGAVSGLTSLTPGRTYYLSDTAGGISLTPGTYLLLVLTAETATTGQIIVTQPSLTNNIRFGGSNIQLLNSSDSNENTLLSVPILGGTLGSNDIIRVRALVKSDAGVTTTFKVYYGGTEFGKLTSLSSGAYGELVVDIANRNNTAIQISTYKGYDVTTLEDNGTDSGTVDTATTLNLTVTVKQNAGGAQSSIEYVSVMIFK